MSLTPLSLSLCIHALTEAHTRVNSVSLSNKMNLSGNSHKKYGVKVCGSVASEILRALRKNKAHVKTFQTGHLHEPWLPCAVHGECWWRLRTAAASFISLCVCVLMAVEVLVGSSPYVA